MMEFNLELYKGRSEIIRQTAEQIIRDFGRFGFEITFSGHTEMAYEELFQQLDRIITHLIETDFGRLYALLYQIDLSERQILAKRKEFPQHSDAEIITELIIHRELQKVLTRKYFKMHKENQSGEPL